MAVSRAEFDRLERRLSNAEKTIQLQASYIQELQDSLDLLQGTTSRGPPVGSAYTRSPGPRVREARESFREPLREPLRERSRTPGPRGSAPAYPTRASSLTSAAPADPAALGNGYGHTASDGLESFESDMISIESMVDDFVHTNALDTKCRDALLNQPLDVVQAVVNQGPAEGRNPSAMVMSRIARAQKDVSAFAAEAPLPLADSLPEQVESFIAENALDEMCSEALRTQGPDCQAAVIGQGPASGRNASAMVMGRIAKYGKKR